MCCAQGQASADDTRLNDLIKKTVEYMAHLEGGMFYVGGMCPPKD